MKLNLNIPVTKLYVVEAHLLSAEEVVFRVQKMVRKKEKLERTILAEELPAGMLKKTLKRDFPVVLVITGKGIISRKTEVPVQLEPKNVLNQLLANGDLETFTIQYFPLPGKLSASAVRSDIVKTVVEKIPRANIVIDLYIGDSVTTALSVFRSYEEVVSVYNYKVILENDTIIDYEMTDTRGEFRHSDEITAYEMIPGYAAGVNFFSGILHTETGGADWLFHNQTEQQHKYQYNYVRLGLMGVLLLILLVNDYYGRQYNNDIEAIQKEQNDKIVKLEVANSLKEKVSMKKSFVLASGMHSQSVMAAYAEDLSRSVPRKITLTELSADPLEKNLTKKNRAVFEKNLIVVRGECNSSQAVNGWLDKIKRFGWVERAVISNYQQNRRENFSEFELEIRTNGDLE